MRRRRPGLRVALRGRLIPGETDSIQGELWKDGEAFLEHFRVLSERLDGKRLRKTRKPRRRFVMLEFLRSLPLTGAVAECGCKNGVSTTLIAEYLRDTGHAHLGFEIFDSFEGGLSAPIAADLDPDRPLELEGRFSIPLERVRDHLREFPFITYHPGWIPESFAATGDRPYSFVHIDLDLYEPILASLEYFYPRLTRPGAIAVDDIESPLYLGAKRAVDAFAAKHGFPYINTTVGYAIFPRH